MLLNILNRKKFTEKNGETIVDLTYPTMGKSTSGVQIIDVFWVADMEMRPDLLSYVAYYSEEYFDYILKFNGVSNPYSISKDMIMYIPEMGDFATKFDTAEIPTEIDKTDNIRDQYKEKTTGVDPKRTEYHSLLKKLKGKNLNQLDNVLPPNIQVDGGNEGLVENNQIKL